jgi:hypothetical protein
MPVLDSPLGVLVVATPEEGLAATLLVPVVVVVVFLIG